MDYLGIDVSKEKFDVALIVDKKAKHKVFKNNKEGYEKLNDWLRENSADLLHCCMESTGRYGEDLAKHLCKQNHKVSIVNPACIKAFALSQLKRAKTDKVDALLIARFCEINNPSNWNPPSERVERLIELTRRVKHLGKLRTSENNHLKSGIRSSLAIQSTKRMLCVLDEEIESLKKEVSKIVDLDNELKRKKDLLKTIPGISDQTAEMILSETKGGIEAFESARQLAAYTGITPRIKQSGTSLNNKGRISKLRNSI